MQPTLNTFMIFKKRIYPNSVFKLRVWKKNTQVTEKEEKREQSRNKLEKSRNDLVKAGSLISGRFANPKSLN